MEKLFKMNIKVEIEGPPKFIAYVNREFRTIEFHAIDWPLVVTKECIDMLIDVMYARMDTSDWKGVKLVK